jgi:hypothetical protein
MAEDGQGDVWKAMELPDGNSLVFESAQDGPPAFSPEVKRQKMVFAHRVTFLSVLADFIKAKIF